MNKIPHTNEVICVIYFRHFYHGHLFSSVSLSCRDVKTKLISFSLILHSSETGRQSSLCKSLPTRLIQSDHTWFSHHWLMFSCSVVSDTLLPFRLFPARFLHPWDFPGKNTGVGCHFLLQEIFPTQESNPGLCLLCWQMYSLLLSHLGSPYHWVNLTILCDFPFRCGSLSYHMLN